jgi:hypothetical protein
MVIMNIVKEPINLGMSSEGACKGDSPYCMSREAVIMNRGGARGRL